MGAKLCIDMNGQTTEIKKDSGEPKKFAFDYSYWSHDGYKVLPDGYFEPSSSRYADQVSRRKKISNLSFFERFGYFDQ